VEAVLKREGPCDVLVIAGDITTRGTAGEVESTISALRRYGQPVVAVAGNMDPPSIDGVLGQLGVGIDGRGVVIGEAGFFGVSASPLTPFSTPYEIPEEEILRRAEKGWKMVASARWKIFVPHAPPRGTRLDRTFSGAHVGSTAVRDFITAHSPDVVISGHIHEARGTDTMGATRIVNCGQAGNGEYAVVTLGEDVLIETGG
jgi:Icc-related predicted phosphoesterase